MAAGALREALDALADPLSTLGVVLMLVGATTLLASSALSAVPIVLDATTLNGGIRHGLVTFIAVLFILAPAALGGTTVSFAARELIDKHGMSAADVGRYYAINTIGCVFGALVAGFLILPLCGLRIGIVVVASIDILVGLASSLTLGSRLVPLPIGLTAGAACLAAILYFMPPPILLKLNRATEELLHYSEASDASVAVVRNTDDQSMRLFVNGDPQVPDPDSDVSKRLPGDVSLVRTRYDGGDRISRHAAVEPRRRRGAREIAARRAGPRRHRYSWIGRPAAIVVGRW